MRGRARLRLVTLITLARVPFVLVFFTCAMVYDGRGGIGWFFAALVALALAALTDLCDGYLARRWDVVTVFGTQADPLMDKFFYLSTLPLLVYLASRTGHTRHAAALLILTLFLLARDQWVSFLRSIGSLYHTHGAANWSGKARTCVNLPLIWAIYYYEAAPAPIQFFPPWVVYGFEIVSFVLNGISAYVYTREYWPALLRVTTCRRAPEMDDRSTLGGAEQNKRDAPAS